MRNEEIKGSHFDIETFEKARKKSWDLLAALSKKIKPGMTEPEAHEIAKDLFREFESEKSWHPTKIRFAQNTTKPFRAASQDGVVLNESDIYFLDLGPVFYGYEGDVGKTFVLGNNIEHSKIVEACQEVFDFTKNLWKKEKISGEELYARAKIYAEKLGYILAFEGASGHRLADFPHAVYHKGSLLDFDSVPSPYSWVLEIHLYHPSGQFGAFFEDLLC